MVYCQECGSEITNVDTFCPFCGISLQTLDITVDANKEVSDSQNNAVNNSENKFSESDVEMTSDELKSESAADIDMSETIVVDHSALANESEEPEESGYLDIKTLKSDQAEETIVDVPKIQQDDVSKEIDEPKSVGSDLDSSDISQQDTAEESLDLDVSDNQDDIEELLTDDQTDDRTNDQTDTDDSIFDTQEPEGKTEEEVNKNHVLDHPSEQILADEIAVGVVAETVAEENEKSVDESARQINEEHSIKKEESVESTELNLKQEGEFNDVSVLNADVDNNIKKGTTKQEDEEDSTIDQSKEKSKIHNTPSEIQTANDSEIDEAVSVIDSKALAWKENDEFPTTDAITGETEESEEKTKNKSTTETNETDLEMPFVEKGLAKPSETEPNSEHESFSTDEHKDQSPPIDSVKESIEEPKPDIFETDVNLDEVKEPTTSTELVSGKSSEIESIATNKTVSKEQESKITESEKDGEENAIDARSQTTPNIGVGDTDGSKSTKLKPLDEGVVLNGRYEIVRKIGGGGMGAVYLANDKNLGGVLRAVKEMVQSYIEEEQQEKAIQDFKRESMILTSLDHPSIPTIYDYFYDEREARFYLVMKYISGGDLAARIRSAPEGKLDEISVTDWALQISDVLDYLHSKNPPIVYRDLKPANIMIDGNSDKVMLIDFGIARSINKEEKGVTAVGTMGYAPPELFSGNVEPSSDIYSLGSTMFHLLTGADPQNNPLLIFDFQKHPRPRQINPQLSDQMERILMRSVEYNADRRFSSAAELRNSLKEHLENLRQGNVSFGIKETPTAVALSDQPVFCGFCGQKIVATDMFCAFCGAKQPLAQPGVHSQEYHIQNKTAKLVIDGTSELDYHPFELVKSDNLLGRRDPMSNIFPEIDLSKFDPQTKISRKHARIWREGENFILEDLGSSNGTIFISALQDKVKLMPKQTQVLQNGDKIQVGDTILQFMVE